MAGRTVQDVLGFGGALPVVGSMREGLALGPTAVLVGIAPQGGRMPSEWRAWLAEALDHGCDLWSGLHTFLGDDPLLAEKARAGGRRIFDLRRPPADLPIASGLAKTVEPLVVLTVGTDCNVGKMTAQLQLTRRLNDRGVRTRFVATGQTGIMIEGWGIAVDAVVADFIAGAAEWLVLEGARDADVVLVEGQGSINHPGYSGVTLGLLHGSCPDALILCHQCTREYIGDYRQAAWLRIPPLAAVHPAVRDDRRRGPSDEGDRHLAQHVRHDRRRSAARLRGRIPRDRTSGHRPRALRSDAARGRRRGCPGPARSGAPHGVTWRMSGRIGCSAG